MADREFTYKVNVDTKSAQAAGDATRKILANAISSKGGAASADKSAKSEISSQQKVLNAYVRHHRVKVAEILKTTRIEEAALRKTHDIKMRDMRTEANEMNRVFNLKRNQVLKEQALVAKQQQQASVGIIRGALAGDPMALLGGGMAGLAAMKATQFAKQAAQQIVELGTMGSEVARITRSFDQLSESIGISSEMLTKKMHTAVQGTVSDYGLLSRANLLLVTAQQGGVKVTEDQIATLAKFARLRSTQLTMAGQNMSTEEAFDRLIRGISKRESELLDELGVSTKQLAQVTGKSVKEIGGSVQEMLDAILMVAEVDFNTFGDPVVDAAARIEIATANAENQVNDLREALAEPVALIVEIQMGTKGTAAGLLEAWLQGELNKMQVYGAILAKSASDVFSSEIDRLQGGDSRNFLSRTFGVNPNEQRITELSGMGRRLDNLPSVADMGNGDEMKAEQEALAGMAEMYVKLTDSKDGYISKSEEARSVLGSWVAFMESWEANELTTIPQIEGWYARLVSRMAELETHRPGMTTDIDNSDIIESNRRYEEQQVLIEQLLVKLKKLGEAQPLSVLLEDLDLVKDAEKAGIEGASTLKEAMLATISAIASAGFITDEQREKIEALTGAMKALYQSSFGIDIGPRINLASRRESYLPEDIASIFSDAQKVVVSNAIEQRNLNEQTAKAAQSAWEAAARAAQQAWEKAIGSIPGMPGTSATKVTDEQLQAANAGLPQNFADDFLRRAKDELIRFTRHVNKDTGQETLIPREGGQDWADVDPEQIARILGMPAGLPGDVLFNELQKQWESGSFFDNPEVQADIGKFINESSIRASIEDQNKSERGLGFVNNWLMGLGLNIPGAEGVSGVTGTSGSMDVTSESAQAAGGIASG
ncbi:MAG: hypothetical protein E4H01_06115, partial [Lysobacterales bacterium]